MWRNTNLQSWLPTVVSYMDCYSGLSPIAPHPAITMFNITILAGDSVVCIHGVIADNWTGWKPLVVSCIVVFSIQNQVSDRWNFPTVPCVVLVADGVDLGSYFIIDCELMRLAPQCREWITSAVGVGGLVALRSMSLWRNGPIGA